MTRIKKNTSNKLIKKRINYFFIVFLLVCTYLLYEIVNLTIFKNEEYKNKIKINIGLEVDFIEGYEDKTTRLLNKYGENLEDALLSLHFIKLNNGEYTDIDGIKGFERALENLGFESYYEVSDINPIVLNGLSTETKSHDFFSTKGNGYQKGIYEELEDEDFII